MKQKYIKCMACGNFFKYMFTCKKCGKIVCQKCWYEKNSLCFDCMAEKYVYDYTDKILNYEEGHIC